MLTSLCHILEWGVLMACACMREIERAPGTGQSVARNRTPQLNNIHNIHQISIYYLTGILSILQKCMCVWKGPACKSSVLSLWGVWGDASMWMVLWVVFWFCKYWSKYLDWENRAYSTKTNSKNQLNFTAVKFYCPGKCKFRPVALWSDLKFEAWKMSLSWQGESSEVSIKHAQITYFFTACIAYGGRVSCSFVRNSWDKAL